MHKNGSLTSSKSHRRSSPQIITPILGNKNIKPLQFSQNTYYTGGGMWRKRIWKQEDMAYRGLVVF
jgi:hypothetical protein